MNMQEINLAIRNQGKGSARTEWIKLTPKGHHLLCKGIYFYLKLTKYESVKAPKEG